MTTNQSAYHSIKQWRNEHLYTAHSSQQLNVLHDQIVTDVFQKALQLVINENGEPPCEFDWFVLGSAGRFEQGYISDQDHGIVYKSTSQEAYSYFLTLGENISDGLFEVGYPYCDGKVMSSNPIWCKSIKDWTEQLNSWTLEESLDSIRYLQIFFDARTLIGDSQLLKELKHVILQHLQDNSRLLMRFLDNIRHIRKSVGVFGQIHVLQNGPYAGSIDLKHSAFLPFVNGIRLLAMKEGIVESPTLSRFQQLRQRSQYDHELEPFEESFRHLLHLRLSTFQHDHTYTDTHHLFVKQLNANDKKLLKQILKDGEKLHQFVQNCIEKGC